MQFLARYWGVLPALAAGLVALGVIYRYMVRPVVQGVATLIEYAEFLHGEVTGNESSVKGQLADVRKRLADVAGQATVTHGQLEEIAVKVENMDTVWSKWVFSHAHEHAEIWRILALLGYDRRHYDQSQGGAQ